MHISYSELKTWAECAWKHKLIYIDRVNKFVGNEYTAFGRALHTLCEHTIEDKIQEEDYDDFFEVVFEKELMDLLKKNVELNELQHNNQTKTTIKTQHMKYNTKTNIATSLRRTTVNQFGSTASGNHVDVNFNTGDIHIRSNTKGSFQPKK